MANQLVTYYKGLDLIYYIYKLLKSVNSTNLNYPLLLHLFYRTLVPFFE